MLVILGHSSLSIYMNAIAADRLNFKQLGKPGLILGESLEDMALQFATAATTTAIDKNMLAETTEAPLEFFRFITSRVTHSLSQCSTSELVAGLDQWNADNKFYWQSSGIIETILEVYKSHSLVLVLFFSSFLFIGIEISICSIFVFQGKVYFLL